MNKRLIFLFSILVILVVVKLLLPSIYFTKGKNCLNKNNIPCAVNNLKKSYEINSSNNDAEYYYAKALTLAKPDYHIQKDMFELSKKVKSLSAKNLVSLAITEWKRSIMLETGNNYIQQTPSDSNIIRWNKESFPLNVIIIKNADVPDYYDSAIRRGLAIWAKSVSFIDFKITNKKSNAKIVIEINNIPENLCDKGHCKYVLGYTTPKISGSTLKRMHITLYNKNPYGNYYTDKEIFNTVAHELGHALGIMGHSYSYDDLMYPTQSESNNLFDAYKSDFHSISGRDINTINLLYKLEPTITDRQPAKNTVIYTPVILGDNNDIIAKKIEEAQNYIKDSPQIAAGYIDLAGAYVSIGKYNLAEETLLKGFNHAKTDQEKYTIYYNLALVYYYDKRNDDAQKSIANARQIKDTQEIAELENLITNKVKPAH